MIPSVVTRHVRQSLLDYLDTTFSLRDERVRAALEGFLIDPRRGLFKGPYVHLRLPFRRVAVGTDIPLEIAPSFRPFVHQQRAFERLSSADGRLPQPVLVTTGTGSGKTECFLFPILDHVCRHAGQPGIKAVILYPMNALASDQAQRLGKAIWNDPRLKGRVTAGMYIREDEAAGLHGTMGPDHIIDRRETIRQFPPDILLTNYKMLDFLLLRPEDRKLWARNAPDTLRYLVLDELHTYDGAQGSDVACLIRRLKARLGVEPGMVCPVGTSATIGGESAAAIEALRQFAEKLFGERFPPESVLTEERVDVATYLGSELGDFPIPADRDDLAPQPSEEPEAYVGRQARMWLGDGSADPIVIAGVLRRHPFLRLLLGITRGAPRALDEVIAEAARLEPDVAAAVVARRSQALIEGFLALISAARVNDDGELRPFLTCQVHFWVRELTRLLRKVAPDPEFVWWEPRVEKSQLPALPAIYCRDCGEAGWLTTEASPGQPLSTDPRRIYEDFFARHRRLKPIVLGSQPSGTVAQLDPSQLRLSPLPASETDGPTVDEGMLLVTVSDDLSKRTPPLNLRRCPACESTDSLRIIGAGSASLGSVAVSHVFQTPYNADKKMLAFTDSVQDASHRAGFFTARTYRFNLRTAIQSAVEDRPGLSLAEAGEHLITYWSSQLPTPKLVATFLPPDLADLPTAHHYLSNPSANSPTEALKDLRARLGWEVTMEYGLLSRVGRTLEFTGTSTVQIDLGRIVAGSQKLLLRTQEEMPDFIAATDAQVGHFVLGLLHRQRARGGVCHPLLNRYIADRGNTYFLWKRNNPLMSPFGPESVLPRLLSTEPETRVFDRFRDTGKVPNWYHDWAHRALGAARDTPSMVDDFYRIGLRVLIDEGLLTAHDIGKGHQAYGINPASVHLTPATARLRCPDCGSRITVAADETERWLDQRCMYYRCLGAYERDPDERSAFYQAIYRSGRVQRIFAEEHTGLLKRAEREKIEKAFKEQSTPNAPNLLSCTPTLELGINIGDLSAAMAASVPPTPANYLQRIGRAGRVTGNSVVLTLVSAQNHDLYFHEEPLRMMAGEVLPPGCFLDAAEVLKRQFVAFAMDTYTRSDESHRLPRNVRALLAAYDRGQFPKTFLDYLTTSGESLLARFLAMFEGYLSDRTKQRIDNFVRTGEISDRIIRGLESAKQEREEVQRRIRRLKERRKDIQDHPEQMLEEERQRVLQDIELERRALVEIVTELEQRYVLNFFTDEGLLPNYAFPEEGVGLKSTVINRAQPNQQPEILVMEYKRAASTAITELAPFNTFYAGHRHVQIDQVDTGGQAKPAFEQWQFCPVCSHMELVKADTPSKTCPRCGTPEWGDIGQQRLLLHLRRVSALSDATRSLNLDEKDDRERDRYYTHSFLAIAPENLKGGFVDPGLPFGFEHLERITLREVNFGPMEGGVQAALFRAASTEYPEAGFELCRDCGVVANPEDTNGTIQHRAACRWFRSSTMKEQRERVFLYREVESEAIRILLPVSTFQEEERRASFKAALEYGLRLHFGGRPIHLAVLMYDEPVTDGVEGKRQFLVLYDLVPGGTGYLAELVATRGFMDVLRKALDGMLACGCAQEEPPRDGCYNCLLAYQTRFEQEQISRRLAVEMFSEIVRRSDQLQPVDTIGNVPIDALQESELEKRFLAALAGYAERTETAKWTPVIYAGKQSYELQLGLRRYLVEAQVDLGPRDGVAVPSRADFVIRPLVDRQAALPVAVFTDGLAFHVKPGESHGVIGEDVRKRLAIIASGRFRVWSLTWWDVEEFSTERLIGIGWLASLAAKAGQILITLQSKLPRDVTALNPLTQLVEYLCAPDANAWQQAAAAVVLAGIAQKGALAPANDRLVAVITCLLEDPSGLSGCAEPLIEGGGSMKVGLECAGPLASLFAGSIQACQHLQPEGMGAIIRLDDREECRANAKSFREPWRVFLAAFNLLQFLPHLAIVSSESISAYGRGGITGPLGAMYAPEEEIRHAAEAAEGFEEILSPEAEEVIGLVLDGSLRRTLRGAVRNGAPLPVVGYELADGNGRVIAEAEIAWPDYKVGILRPEQADSAGRFEKDGWRIFTATDFVDNLATVIDSLSGTKGV